MHVLIATDGQLDFDRCADLASRLAGSEGSITVLTAVEIPRTLLSSLRSGFDEAELLILDRENVEVRATDGRERSSWPGDDAVIERYLKDRSEAATDPLLAALAERGVAATLDVRESENAAATVLEAIRELSPDVVCVGSHGTGRFEGLLGSTGTKITRLAPCPVLLIRGP
jgi:nucleotide-binding universal stress UspA family protein